MVEADSEDQLRKLELENAQLRKDLDQCHTRILELTREDDQTTDMSIRKDYEALCSFVDFWVDWLLDSQGSFIGRNKLEDRTLSEKFLSPLGIPDDLFQGKRQGPPVSESMLTDAVAWLFKQRNCDCFLVTLVIWRFLEQRVLSRTLPIGMDRQPHGDHIRQAGNAEFLDSVCRILEDEDQAKGYPSRATRWRSETLTAMSHFVEVQREQREQTEDLVEELILILREWVSVTDSVKVRSYSKKCVESAVEIQAACACLKRVYSISRSPLGPGRTLDVMSKEWRYRDISTWRTPLKTLDTGSVITIIPGLYSATDGGVVIQLVKPLMVVYKLGTEGPERPSRSLAKAQGIDSRSSRTSHVPKETSSRLTSTYSQSRWEIFSNLLGLGRVQSSHPVSQPVFSVEERSRRSSIFSSSSSNKRKSKSYRGESLMRTKPDSGTRKGQRSSSAPPPPGLNGVEAVYDDLESFPGGNNNEHRPLEAASKPRPLSHALWTDPERRTHDYMTDPLQSGSDLSASRKHGIVARSSRSSGSSAITSSNNTTAYQVLEQQYGSVSLSNVPRDVGISRSGECLRKRPT